MTNRLEDVVKQEQTDYGYVQRLSPVRDSRNPIPAVNRHYITKGKKVPLQVSFESKRVFYVETGRVEVTEYPDADKAFHMYARQDNKGFHKLLKDSTTKEVLPGRRFETSRLTPFTIKGIVVSILYEVNPAAERHTHYLKPKEAEPTEDSP